MLPEQNDPLGEQWFVPQLRCPDCGNALLLGEDLACSACDLHLPLRRPIDLRPTRTKRTLDAL
jgi:hypothetical protein